MIRLLATGIDPRIIAALITGGLAILGGWIAYRYYGAGRKKPDKEIFQWYHQVFDRSAFKVRHAAEEREPFQQAIDDTLLAINTGVGVSRGGVSTGNGTPKGKINNKEYKDKMYEVEQLLVLTKTHHLQFMQAPSKLLSDQIDKDRNAISAILNPIWDDLGIGPLLPKI
jgi:hypothetical protein